RGMSAPRPHRMFCSTRSLFNPPPSVFPSRGCLRGRHQTRQGARHRVRTQVDAGERRRIAERYAAGETMTALAREYKVGEATVWRAGYPIFVHRAAVLLHASFRPRLATTPLCFAN